MSKEKYYKTLLSPHVPEKASRSLGENSQTVFKVAKDAKKNDWKKAYVTLATGEEIDFSMGTEE